MSLRGTLEPVDADTNLPFVDEGDRTRCLHRCGQTPVERVEVLSIAPLLARAINAVFEDTSVSEIFGGNNLA